MNNVIYDAYHEIYVDGENIPYRPLKGLFFEERCINGITVVSIDLKIPTTWDNLRLTTKLKFRKDSIEIIIKNPMINKFNFLVQNCHLNSYRAGDEDIILNFSGEGDGISFKL